MASDRSAADRLLPWAELAGFAAAGAAIVGIELAQNPEYLEHPRSLFAYSTNPETTWTGLVLLAAPLVWWLGAKKEVEIRSETEPDSHAGDSSIASNQPSSSYVGLMLSLLVFGVSVACTAAVGLNFRSMPPAYHDEYSYIFQARTFWTGRLFYPTHPLPEFFDQMHVLNDDGVFASRYFPGVGLWLAPWVAAGHAHWGQYVAGGLVVVCVFWIARELAATLARDDPTFRVSRFANSVGVVAALLCALSPAMLLFGNLLLSHHPTMLGLAAFVICYLRALRSTAWGWPLAGGIALGFAMLCRPLTAFGFALPFGLHLGWLVFCGKLERPGVRLAAALAPLGVGVALLGGYNAVLSGNPLESPYGKYLRIYTPNHVYGFHNKTGGEKQISPKVLENYNRWAEELTLPRAVNLLAERATTSALWSSGRVSLPWILALFVVLLPRLPVAWRLVAGSIVGLHAAYFSYAFVGIYGLSYVFESVPMLCVVAGGVAVVAAREWLVRGRWGRALWLLVFVLLGMYGPLLRLRGGVSEVRYARGYYAEFEHRLEQAGVRPPAIVFIQPDPADRDRDLVTNSPTLDDPILRVRLRNADVRREELVAMYPDRQLWFYDAQTRVIARVLPTTVAPRETPDNSPQP